MLPTIANVVRGEKNANSTAQQNKEIGEDDEKCWELRARRGWTKRKESHSARPSPPAGARAGEGRLRPLSERPMGPGPRGVPGVPRDRGRRGRVREGRPRGEGCRQTLWNNKLQKKKNKRNFPNAASTTQDKCTNTYTHTRTGSAASAAAAFF